MSRPMDEQAPRTCSVEADCAHGSPADDWRTFAEDLLKWCDEPLDEQETQRQAAQMAARAVLLAGGRMAANAEG